MLRKIASKRLFRTRALRIEQVESRQLMAMDFASVSTLGQPTIEISAHEQLILEMVNRARGNPMAEAARLGIELNQGLADGAISTVPKQPLAPNAALSQAAKSHTEDMLTQNYFEHVGKDGSTPTQRAQKAGYPSGAAENISVNSYWGDAVDAAVAGSHDNLFLSPGHRANLMSDAMRDFGVGVSEGMYTFSSGEYQVVMTTENFGRTNTPTRAVTGVVYTDAIIDDNFYSIGEGMAGISIGAERADGEFYETKTASAGGYTLELPPGQYRLIAFNPANNTLAQLGNVTVSDVNLKVDITADQFLPVSYDGFMPIGNGDNGNTDDSNPLLGDSHSQYDVNLDGKITPIDILQVVNYLNNHLGSYEAAFDMNGDLKVSPIDALLMINYYNNSPSMLDANRSNASVKLDTGLTIDGEGSASTTVDSLPPIVQDMVSKALDAVRGWYANDIFETEVVSVKPVDWHNSNFGLPGISQMAITPGYQIVLRHATLLFEYRTDLNGSMRYAGFAKADAFLDNPNGTCCPWDMSANCLVAIDEALMALTDDFINSEN